MSGFLYLTADTVGADTGGGVVTKNEVEAFKTLGPCDVWDRTALQNNSQEPWKWDDHACANLHAHHLRNQPPYRLCHIYSGTWGKTVKRLEEAGTKVSITIAAHDRFVSRREHERLGMQFPYTHLTDEPLWNRYIEGYRRADAVICPSTVAADTVRSYGGCNSIAVIPHGCTIPGTIAPVPKTFVLGYLGVWGPDKGLVYLMQAWGRLKYKDAVLLIAGDAASHPIMHQWHQQYGGNVCFMGRYADTSQFFNQISCYVQPSATEGFGIPVLEAMAHGRMALCSKGAGAQDVVAGAWRFPACNAIALVDRIHKLRKLDLQKAGDLAYKIAQRYTWEKVRQQYVDFWKGLLNG